MKMRVKSFQYMQAASLAISFVVIFVGTIINQHDHKFARSYNTSCDRGILILNSEDSHVCCDAHATEHSWVCAASFDPANKVLSSVWAFVIPLVPFFLTVLLNRQASLKANVRRLALYAGIFAFRTVVLYMLPVYLEGLLGRGEVGELLCWCKDFVSSSKCQLLFDFSDHIVLSLVQYMLPCVLEAHYCLCSCGLLGTSPSGGATSSAYAAPSLLAAAIIVLASLRSMLLTCMYFHTSMENAVGFAVAAALAYAPLCTKRAAVLWAQVVLAQT
ncbi:hypothetical protein B484DRAFT_451361 [Ochromonadaceae sp. CCMP2298]|nr:hypothetical protein B484DRAFT_451361 [Ochromonadaceae sp. CCMP2298]